MAAVSKEKPPESQWTFSRLLHLRKVSLGLGGGQSVASGSSGGLGGGGVVLVQLHELGEIELGLLDELDLADHAVVLEGEDLAALLLDLFANVVFNAIN